MRVAVSILAKASFQKAFVSHCMEFLAVFHSQCLSAGTRLEAKQKKQSTTSGTADKAGSSALTLIGMGQKPRRCYCSYRERLMTQIPEMGLGMVTDIRSSLAYPFISKID